MGLKTDITQTVAKLSKDMSIGTGFHSFCNFTRVLYHFNV